MEIQGFGAMVNETEESKQLSVQDYLDFFVSISLSVKFFRFSACMASKKKNQKVHDEFNRIKFYYQLFPLIMTFSPIFEHQIWLIQRNLIDAVSTMELNDLRRSTLLNDSISVGVEEVINDLKHLDWKKYDVNSLLTRKHLPPPPAATLFQLSAKDPKRQGSENYEANSGKKRI